MPTNSYQPYSFTPYPNLYSPYQTQQMPIQQPQAQQQPQAVSNANSDSNAFISVRSKAEALNWHVAPGQSVSFKDESEPGRYYSKSRGMSQFDEPVFKSYHLVEDLDESSENQNEKRNDENTLKLKEEMDKLIDKVNELSSTVEKLGSMALVQTIPQSQAPVGFTTATPVNTLTQADKGVMHYV